MHLYQYFSNSSVEQLQRLVESSIEESKFELLERLLDLTVLKSIAKQIDPPQKPRALLLFRSNPSQLVLWLDAEYPAARVASIEALTRVLLSLTVE